MKIKKIIIKNFRAFDTVEIDFADFNCIIGKNDCGKSTVFAALDWFFNDKGFIDNDDKNINATSNDISVEITFENSDGDVIINKRISHEGYLDVLKIKSNPIYIFNGKEFSNTQWAEFLKTESSFQLPNFELFTPLTPLKTYLNKLFHNEVVCDETKISNIANEISNKMYGKTGEIDFSFVNCDFFPNSDMPLYTSETDAWTIPIRNRGEGFQQKIKNSIFRIFAEKPKLIHKDAIMMCTEDLLGRMTGSTPNHLSTSTIFAFEEPETHLHPSAQLEMFNTIKSLSTKYQVLMTTHSPYIVKALQGDNNAKIVVLERNAEEHTTTRRDPQENVLSYSSMNEINYIAFDEPSIEYHIELFGYIHERLKEKYQNDPTFKKEWDNNLKIFKHSIEADEIAHKTNVDINWIAAVDAWLINANSVASFNTNVAHNNKWYNYDKDKKNYYEEYHRSLPYCVRNWIDHPMTKREEKPDEEKKYNIAYNKAYDNNKNYGSPESLRESIDIMRRVITENDDIFSRP